MREIWMGVARRLFSVIRQYFRRKRYARICSLIKVESLNGFILDLGGGPASFFAAQFPQPRQVILVELAYELAYQAQRRLGGLHVVVADGRKLPFRDWSIAATVCNSVIEHVSCPYDFAAEILRTSKSYFVQTPSADFPFETHSFVPIPFFNFIPWVWMRRYACTLLGADFDYVNGVHYLSELELRELFPEAAIVCERVFGLDKSFYVYHVDSGSD